MTKGYWIGRVDVADKAAYGEYLKRNGAAFGKFGARFLVRGGRFEAPEGTPRARNVVIEFDSYETALACYNSTEYQEAMAHRLPPVGINDLVIIEGFDG